MSDLVQRLRSARTTQVIGDPYVLLDDAADEIERLWTVIERYLADDFSCNGGAEMMFREALKQHHD